jgi:hypothetical protein
MARLYPPGEKPFWGLGLNKKEGGRAGKHCGVTLDRPATTSPKFE